MSQYEELIKALRFETDYVPVEKTMRDAAAAIEALQAQINDLIAYAGARIGKAEADKPHWVSVFDDLPRHNAVVVVSDGKRSWDVGQYHFLFNTDDRTRWWWKKHTTRKVLWWMYKEDALPEPPQEVQE